MFRERRPLSVYIGKVCKRNCASWESGDRDASRSRMKKKDKRRTSFIDAEAEIAGGKHKRTLGARIRISRRWQHAFWARQGACRDRRFHDVFAHACAA